MRLTFQAWLVTIGRDCAAVSRRTFERGPVYQQSPRDQERLDVIALLMQSAVNRPDLAHWWFGLSARGGKASAHSA